MVNQQANSLIHAVLKRGNAKLHLLCFEPLIIRKGALKKLAKNDTIALGKKLPDLYIYRKGMVVGQAELGQIDGRETIIVSAAERIANLGKADTKHAVLECRIAIVPKEAFVVGKLFPIPKDSLASMLLFVKGKQIASVALKHSDEGYFLQVNEVSDV